MAKTSLLIILFVLVAASYPAYADPGRGKEVFLANKCDTCHYPDTVSLGPTLEKISSTYKGKKARLIRFLSGKEKPIVFPEKFESVMEAYLGNTKLLTPEQRKDLADVIMSHGEKGKQVRLK